MAAVADPQLTDVYSYPFMASEGVLAKLTQWFVSFLPRRSFLMRCRYSDIYMRRAFSAVQRHASPDLVSFLGDLFDGGRVVDSSQYVAGLCWVAFVLNNPRLCVTHYITTHHSHTLTYCMHTQHTRTYTHIHA